MPAIVFAPTLLITAWSLFAACGGEGGADTGPAGDGAAEDGGATDGGADGGAAAGDAVVVITGGVYLQTGATLELTVTTVNGTDSGYTWQTSDDAVATVEDGVVTGVGVGEAVITATGVDTAASGSTGVYVSEEIPNLDAWASSGHADHAAEAFNHWNDEGEISASCARCHATPGFLDYIGADGSAADSVESAAPVGTVIECEACHNDVAQDLSHVVFPSGVTVDGLGGEARCMTCHQGRASTPDVNDAFAEAGASLSDAPDTVNDKLSFANIHYYPAGATLYAGEVMGGYQYDGAVYDWRFRHVSDEDVCIECHDPHDLQVRVDECGACHEGVSTVEDLKDVRMMASLSSDYDGDGDTTEGIFYEIDGLAADLLAAIQSYVLDQGLPAICYDANAYPYFFNDTDGDGACGGDETSDSNAYASWTPRLVAAAYNHQVARKDPGGFAHNAKYIIQLLHDSLQSISEGLSAPLDLSSYDRNDPGHFNGAGEAARHWDEDETISSSCSACHGGAEGLHFYVQYGVGLEDEAPDNGLECETCHVDIPTYGSTLAVDSVEFPGGVVVDNDDGSADFICMSCHRGRESGASVTESVDSGDLSFQNVHYLAAAATRYGGDAGVGYEYPGRSYAGASTGHLGGDGCTDCHNPANTEHSFRIEDNFDTCAACHSSAREAEDIRGAAHDADYDGDGDASEPLAGELEGLSAALLARMQAVATDAGHPLCYDADSYPYFFADTDGSGDCSADEASYGNRYADWTAPLLAASFNYQFARTEPGAWAHNFDYMGQLLYDSLDDLDGDLVGRVRPASD